MKACLAFMACALLVATSARGARACATDRPFVVLTTKVQPPDQVIADALRDHLRTSLDARGIGLCVDPTKAQDPVGFVRLEVRRAEAGAVTARIVIGDEITDKRVERTMDLTSVPPDARPLAVSASGDELLRASWAELLIADAPPPKKTPPSVVVDAVKSALRTPDELDELTSPEVPDPTLREHAIGLGLLGHGAIFANLETFGADLRLGYWFMEQFHIHAQGRVSFSLSKAGMVGAVRQRTQGGAMGVSYAFWPVRSTLSLAVEADLGVHRVELLPSRDVESVRERPADDWTMETAFGPRGYLTMAPFQLSLGMAMRLAIRPSQASAGDEVLLSNNRIGAEASLGVHLIL